MKIMSFLLITLILILFGGACVQTSPTTTTIDLDLHEGTQLAFDISPDGSTIVFDLLGQIWTLSSTGGDATPLTNAVSDTADDSDPAFSPDGSQIVFWSDRAQGLGLWLLTDEERLRQLTEASSRYQDTAPAWAPDGRHIALIRSNAIHILDVASGEVQRLRVDSSPRGQIRAPTWSPDGTRLAFAAGDFLWEVPSGGGIACPLTSDGMSTHAPAYSPDGNHIAFICRDSNKRPQVFLLDRTLGEVEQLTSHGDVTERRVRWSPDGEWLYYSADGKLWRTSMRGGIQQEIPFHAVLHFDRRSTPVRPVRFATPGSAMPARGNMGVTLSPSGMRIALIALDRLWVLPVGGEPEEVSRMSVGASGPSWSPDETTILWSGGPAGAEDIFATEVATGQTRRITALPGREDRASWSSDGKWIAFLHWEKPALASPPWQGFSYDSYLRVVPADGPPCSDVSETIDLGDLDYRYTGDLFDWSQEAPRWVPGSNKILVFTSRGKGQITTVSLSGEQVSGGSLPEAATFVGFGTDRSLVFLDGNALWQVGFHPDSGITSEPERLSDDPAFSPSASQDGSILYLSADGYRIRRPDADVQHLGWPLTFEVPTPEPIFIRNARIVVGNDDVLTSLHDIHVEAGRIASVTPAGTLSPDDGVRAVDAQGRTVIPGLIDAHTHLHDQVSVAALLYHGVTAFRDMGAVLTQVAGMRDTIDAGARVGSRVVFGGVKIMPGRSPDGLSGQSIQSQSDPAAVNRLLALLKALDASSVKMQWHDRLAPGVAMIRAARAAGFPVSGHCALQLAFVAAGISGREHLGAGCDVRSGAVLYSDMAQLINTADLWVVPTLSAWSAQIPVLEDTTVVDEPEIAQFLTPFNRWRILRIRPSNAQRYHGFLDRARAAARSLYNRGVQLVTGTDIAAIPTALHKELEEFVDLGMSPLEALTAGTGAAARVLGAEDEIGTVEEGKWADLVILNADPLEDIQNTRNIWMVIKGGEIIDREGLVARAGEALRN